jgi:cytochrome c oxidase subunit 2
MTSRVRAVSVDEYQRWLAQQKTDIKAAEDAAAKQRQQLESGASSTQTP